MIASKAILIVAGAISLLWGMGIWITAESAIHEIEALNMFIIFIISVVGCGIIQAIEKVISTIGQIEVEVS